MPHECGGFKNGVMRAADFLFRCASLNQLLRRYFGSDERMEFSAPNWEVEMRGEPRACRLANTR